jgi:hypothetical protein
MQDGVAAAVLALLAHIGTSKAVQHSEAGVASAAAAAAAAAAGVLRALTTADDERPPASKAFLHARQLAGNPHNALSVLLPVLQQLQSCDPLPAGHLTAVMAAVRQVRDGLKGFEAHKRRVEAHERWHHFITSKLCDTFCMLCNDGSHYIMQVACKHA